MKYYLVTTISLMFLIIVLSACSDALTTSNTLPIPPPTAPIENTPPVAVDETNTTVPEDTTPIVDNTPTTAPFTPVVVDPPTPLEPIIDPVTPTTNPTTEPTPIDPPPVTEPTSPVTEPTPEPTQPPTWESTVASRLNITETPFTYSQQTIPNHVSPTLRAAFDNTPADNPIDDKIATLGRVLFYDKQLSVNNTIACASCHFQENAFSDPARLSIGFQGGQTPRNSMGLANSRFYENGRFFWDERAETLEAQTLMPIQDSIEMGLSLEEMTTKLSATDYYLQLFEWSYGDTTVSSERVSKALAQFVRSMISFESRYDAGLAVAQTPNQAFANFTAAENAGKALFFSRRTNCAACHVDNVGGGPPGGGEANDVFFFMNTPRNNGLDAGLNSDNGLGDVTNRANDNGDFKVPSLRNIELTAPYMHDGRLATLELVIDHYSNGIQNHPNLDNRLRVNNGQPVRMNFSTVEKANLVAFLKTLTDTEFIQNEAYSNPFK